MKPARLTPAAKQDRRDELHYYRAEAGSRTALKLLDSLQTALQTLSLQPSMGSPLVGRALGIDGMRAWRLDGFPLSLWYLERDDHVLVVRVVGQRQDADVLSVATD